MGGGTKRGIATYKKNDWKIHTRRLIKILWGL